jgi:16S rRNA (cytidine1402-2'-O)-methyltransferase
MPGTLFVVATPIGNLEDITYRAVRLLGRVSLVAAEDTRHTATLLHHYRIQTPTTSFHEHNEREKLPVLVSRLLGGDDIALVTDAGTPGVSDPGYRLVRAAIAEGVRVEAVPGASAVLAALAASGLPTDAFTFLGFPPPKARARREWFRRLAFEPRTLVFFEAPHRLADSLTDVLAVLGDREAVVGRELTKLHEEMVRGRISMLLPKLENARGEITVVLAPAGREAVAPADRPPDEALRAEFIEAAEGGSTSRREALSRVAGRHGLPVRDVYAAVERAKAVGVIRSDAQRGDAEPVRGAAGPAPSERGRPKG